MAAWLAANGPISIGINANMMQVRLHLTYIKLKVTEHLLVKLEELSKKTLRLYSIYVKYIFKHSRVPITVFKFIFVVSITVTCNY